MSNIDWSQLITAEGKEAQERASLMARFEIAIQGHIDTIAQSHRYRDGFALAGYVASTVPQYAAEATAFVAWRDAVWLYAYGELDKALNGQREIPTVDDFIAELPEMEWPI